MIVVLFFPLILILLVTLFNALTAPQVGTGPEPRAKVKVSILIPARNEEINLDRCLAGLCAQDYPDLEILVLDDGSTDTTAKIIESWARRDPRVRGLRGEPVPPEWTGKNWACQQLSSRASGGVLIFTDADNRHAPKAVARTVGWMQKLGLGLFSAFPQQETVTLGEKLVVPVFDLFVYSLLPLWLTYASKYPSLSAANGQWLAVTRPTYEALGGHRAVRGQVVEDVELARRAKRLKVRILTASGGDHVRGRMYRSWAGVWSGFSKNAFGLMSFKTVPFFILLVFLFAAFVLPYGLVFHGATALPAAAAILMTVTLRLILVLKFRQPPLVSTLLNPVSIGATLLVGINSYICWRRGYIIWKGRKVALKSTGKGKK